MAYENLKIKVSSVGGIIYLGKSKNGIMDVNAMFADVYVK